MTDEKDSSGDTGPAPPTRSTGRSLECSLCPFESFDYHPEEATYVAVFDAAAVTPSTAVVGALSTVAGAEPREIEPLYTSVDVDALDSLFGSGGHHEVRATFTVGAYEVTLVRDEETRVRLREAAESTHVIEV